VRLVGSAVIGKPSLLLGDEIKRSDAGGRVRREEEWEPAAPLAGSIADAHSLLRGYLLIVLAP